MDKIFGNIANTTEDAVKSVESVFLIKKEIFC